VKRYINLIFFCLLISINYISGREFRYFATKDSNTIINKSTARTAMILSTILPGAGQIYNNSIWKVPLIYGGGGIAIYYLNYWQKRYDLTLKYLKSNENKEIYYIYGRRIPKDRLDDARDFYRYYRDWSVISIGLIYAANIIDALVDGYMKQYDISDDLSFKIKPHFNTYAFSYKPVYMLTIQLNF